MYSSLISKAKKLEVYSRPHEKVVVVEQRSDGFYDWGTGEKIADTVEEIECDTLITAIFDDIEGDDDF